MTRRSLLGTLGAATLTIMSGCATPAGATLEATALPPVAAGKARVIFYCTSSWTVPNIWRRVEVGGQQFGEIGMGQFMVIDVTPGAQHVRLWRPSFTGSGPGEQFVLDGGLCSGEAMYVRFVSRAGAGAPLNSTTIAVLLDNVPESMALKELNGLKQTPIGLTHGKAT